MTLSGTPAMEEQSPLLTDQDFVPVTPEDSNTEGAKAAAAGLAALSIPSPKGEGSKPVSPLPMPMDGAATGAGAGDDAAAAEAETGPANEDRPSRTSVRSAADSDAAAGAGAGPVAGTTSGNELPQAKPGGSQQPPDDKLNQFVNFLHGDNPGACQFHAQMRLSHEGCRKLANFIKSSNRVRALSLSHNLIGGYCRGNVHVGHMTCEMYERRKYEAAVLRIEPQHGHGLAGTQHQLAKEQQLLLTQVVACDCLLLHDPNNLHRALFAGVSPCPDTCCCQCFVHCTVCQCCCRASVAMAMVSVAPSHAVCLTEGFLCPRCREDNYVFLVAALVQPLLASLTACCCCYLPCSGDAGLRILCEGLSNNKSVTALDLPDNDISDEGIKELMLALVHNTSLTQLQLAYNKIGNDGAAALAQVRQGGQVAGVVNWPGLVRMVLTLDDDNSSHAYQTLRITSFQKIRWAGGVTRAVECEFILVTPVYVYSNLAYRQHQEEEER